MIQSTRRWFRRNRTNFAVGAGVLGAGYLAGQYVLGKVSEARMRMSEERVAKENLRRRFQQNQEDCTFTVLAILPTATENICDAIPVEHVLEELQRQKAERLARSVGPSEIGTSAAPSVVDTADTGEDDGGSGSVGTEGTGGYVRASQVVGEGEGSTGGEGSGGVDGEDKRSKKSKAELWNEMKISSITRAFTLLYTLSLLTLLTRIQLNLLGRRNYLASVVLLATPPSAEGTEGSRINLENNDDDNEEGGYGNDFETNRRYLSLSWWLLHKGCMQIIGEVREAVQDVFGALNPREEVELERLGGLVLEVRRRVEGSTEGDRRSRKWLPYLLPPADKEPYVLHESGMSAPSTTTSTSLRRLIDETSDLIDSPHFSHILTLLLDAAFSHLIDTKISSLAYKIPLLSSDTARVQELVGTEIGHKKAKVASSLAVFCRQAHAIGTGVDNEYVKVVEGVRGLEAFAAVVYSSHFEFERAEPAAEPSFDTGMKADSREMECEGVDLGLGRSQTVEDSLLGGLRGFEEKVGEVKVEEEERFPGMVAVETKSVEREEVEKKDDGFESAWGKALAKEDGKAH